MFTPPPAGRRSASARRQLMALLLAALLVLPNLLLPGASFVPTALADTGTGSVSLTATGVAFAENFNTLSNTAGSTTNSTLPTGWYITETGSGARDNEQYAVDTGGSNTGDTFSYGAAGATDRALGGLQSGTLIPVFGAKFTNNTGATITSLDIAYTGEQWRIANTAAARDDRIDFQISTNATDLSTGTYADVNALDFTNPVKTAASAGALDGNAAANRTALSTTISGLNIANGASFFIRWTDLNASGADDGLSVDDFSVTASGVPPATPTISIDDVSHNEGNAGTTAFTFTVSLSSSTHGGVTFDICSQDGTAQDGSNVGEDTDYSPICFGSQTIANGSDSAQYTVNVNGDTNVEADEDFFVNLTSVTGATVADGQGKGTIVTDDIVLTLIHDVQGNGAASPLVGQVVTVRGVVTLLKSNGFFIQEEVGDNDADPNTSEGIFVFTSSAPTVGPGDQATVTGTVAEFNGLTELTSPSVSVNSTGNTLPTAVTITVADLPANASPAQPQLEKYESMRLFASSLTTVAPNDSFFDVFTVITGQPRPLREPGIPASDPIPPDPTSGTPDPNIAVWDENPERLVLDTNGRQGSTGDTLTSNVVITNVAGPLDFAFGAYRLINEAALTRTANMTAVAAPAPDAGEFTVASYNIENFNNNATQREKVSLTVRTLLHYPDVIGAVEIFDLADLQALRDEINNDAVAAGDPNPMYEAYLVEQDGTSEDSDQDVGFLVKTSRVTVTSVTQEREEETFINPVDGQPETLHDRPPLVLDAVVDPSGASPQRALVVVNHLRSFIDIELVAGEGVRVREKRKKQAESLADLLNDLQTANPGVPVISVGDYNAFQFSSGYDDSVSVLKGDPTPDDEIVVDQSPDLVDPNFFNLIDELPAAERYSFVFEGTPQALDHHLVNAAARARNTRIAIARVNSDFPDVPAATYASNAAVPERNSDHDPVVSYYALGTPQATGTLIISEFRLRGPGGTEDEFVELYNATNSDLTVMTLDGSAGFALVASDGAVLHAVPNGTVIPARGHYLVANANGYSLNGYAEADATHNHDTPNGAGLALFRTANPVFFDESNRLDAAGYTSAPALYREGAGIPATGDELTLNIEHSLLRHQIPGLPVDTGNNATDFIGVDTNAFNIAGTQRLGAPGPENLSSPVTTLGQVPGLLLDSSQPGSQAPNRVRDLSGAGNNPTFATFGTLSIRRRFVNNTGQAVALLRFRIANLTTFPAPTGTADLRALSSVDVVVSNVMDNDTCTAAGEAPPCTITVSGTTLDAPPAQPNGGGWNSSLSLPVSLAAGDSVNVQFLLGVQQAGNFRFFVNVEAEAGEEEGGGDALKAAPKKSRFGQPKVRPRLK